MRQPLTVCRVRWAYCSIARCPAGSAWVRAARIVGSVTSTLGWRPGPIPSGASWARSARSGAVVGGLIARASPSSSKNLMPASGTCCGDPAAAGTGAGAGAAGSSGFSVAFRVMASTLGMSSGPDTRNRPSRNIWSVGELMRCAPGGMVPVQPGGVMTNVPPLPPVPRVPT